MKNAPILIQFNESQRQFLDSKKELTGNSYATTVRLALQEVIEKEKAKKEG